MHAYIRPCRVHFFYAGLFSLFINLLLLSVPLYSMQVFDRVLTSPARLRAFNWTMAAALLLSMAPVLLNQ